ncbi:MAG: DUF5597 domain-containing protein [Clostridiales bacterium]|nr:DUF5597 domain-containing protein [Clostridiales bacterium]
MKSLFQVNGAPFFSIGGQTNNSSAYHAETIRQAFKGIEAMGMNTIAAPVYWELLEPRKNEYCFEQIDMILEEAEARKLKVILLWFGSWKNGASHYIPEWMKREKETYRVCKNKSGMDTAILSPLCEKNLEKDAEAFERIVRHVREKNANGTVLALQVENEPGHLGTPRDYSETANQVYESLIPEDLFQWIRTLRKGSVYDCVSEHNCEERKNWQMTFGFYAPEIFSAYYVCKYIEKIAKRGKSIYDIPMYVNVWVRETTNRIAGIDYPSGGGTSLVLDLWKAFAPHIDCIAPDIYFESYEIYNEICSIYKRADNLLYIPESKANGNNGRHLLRMIEKHELSSVHCFAIDSIFDGKGDIKEECLDYKDTISVLAAMKPLIEKYHGTGRIYAVAQYEGMDSQFIDFGDYYGRVYYLNCISDEAYIHLDPSHNEEEYISQIAKGLIIYEGNGSFYLAGRGYKLVLIKRTSLEEMSDILVSYKQIAARNISYFKVEEGYFDEENRFKVTRKRNGDESDMGLWVEPDIGVLHAEL